MDLRIISIAEIVSACSFFMLVITLGGRMPRGRVVGAVRDFSGMLVKKERELGVYYRCQKYLKRNGVQYHYGKKISPERMVIVSLLLMCVGLLVGMQLSVVVAIVAAVLGCLLPWMLISVLNRSDNEKMLQDIKMIYQALAMQIRSGVYVTDALAECSSSVREKRLRDALFTLGGDIVMKSDLFSALEKFQACFDNRYIDSLCITIMQAMESGKAVELLADIAEQVRDMEKAVLEKRKARLDRSITFYQLGMLVCVLAVSLYACVEYMFTAALGF